MTVLISLLLGVTAYSGTYAEGVEAYERQEYVLAIEHFETLVYNRVYEPEVFYNLGNAYFQVENYPQAMVNYERALRMNPTLAVAHDNVRQVVMLTQQQLARPQPGAWEKRLYFWHHAIQTQTSAGLALGAWWMMWITLALRSVGHWKYLRRVAVFFAMGTCVFFGSWYLKDHPMELAVVQGDSVPVRIGVQETDSIRFELNWGDRVQIDAEQGEYVRIQTVHGDRGWVPVTELIRVWPPERGTGS